VRAPLPADAPSKPDADLTSVACPGTSSCFATGTYYLPGPVEAPLVEQLRGGHWLPARLPVPVRPASYAATPQAISCASPSSCTVVGTLYSEVSLHGLIETFTSGRWAASLAPLPANARTDQLTETELWTVSCPTIAMCAAGGFFHTKSGRQEGLLLTRGTIRR
jgi:hypothetical protein